MLKSYFFIPGHKKQYLEGLSKYNPDFFVVDLEDAVALKSREIAISFVKETEIDTSKTFLRIWDIQDFLKNNFNLGEKFSKFILPKVETKEQVYDFISNTGSFLQSNETEIIITIESPMGVVKAMEIMEMHHESISGISFGSHDYCKTINATHELQNYSFARDYIFNIAKAFNKKFIDTASTNLDNAEYFESECIKGFRMGCDGKPILHPKQLEWFQSIAFYSFEEITFSQKVVNFFNGKIPSDIEVIVIEGQIIEKPHIDRILKIQEFINKKG